jgi:uncharacterized membrane protein YfcA
VPEGLLAADIASIVAALIAAGMAIGLLAGLFGIGGGAISVPIFFEVFRLTGNADDVAMPLAVGTSLAMIVPTAFVSAREHARRGTIDGAVLRAWAVPILGGVIVGSALARFAEAELFQVVFAAVALLMAVRMLTGGASWRIAGSLPGRLALSAYGAAIGLLSALMGIGGGALSTMILTLHGRPIHEAVSTSAGVGLLIAIPGTIGYVLAGWGKPDLPPDAFGYVSLLALAFTMPTTLLLTRLGVRAAHALSREALLRLFGGFLLLVSLRFLAAIFLGL